MQDTGDLSNTINSFAKGITGERFGEIGDVIRTTGFGGQIGNPIISSLIGISSFAGSIRLQMRVGLLKMQKKF